ncbi:MAG: tetratricopeptide repeat protein [Chloroflexi bacterium]|nr:tetratricopeptide repeat protein [Chloroflexota bacterium]
MTTPILRNPYVGPRPFTNSPEDIDVFFGRTRETRQIFSLVVAEPAILVFGQSGTGKTSLLRAGLQPMLEDNRFEVWGPVRVQGYADNPVIRNIFIYNALRGWVGEGAASDLAQMSLTDFLHSRPRSADSERDLPLRILIFDQFEELFTAYGAERWTDREKFFRQITQALKEDEYLRVMFFMREDFIGELVPYETLLPGRLEARFRLERLRRDPAFEAVTGPVEKTPRRYVGGAAELLVDKLIRVENVVPPVGTEEFVEPVILQVVCSRLWDELDPQAMEFTSKQVDKFDPARALQAFYEQCLEAAVKDMTANSPEVEKFAQGTDRNDQAEETLRNWFENTLITKAGTRNMVRQGEADTEGLANNIVLIFQDKHIIRPVEGYRGHDRWFELAHDRFIDPIRKSNADRQLERQSIKAVQQQLRADKIESYHFKLRTDLQVFLSYSRRDRDFVTRLYERLAANGVDTWVDWEDIPSSADWRKEIQAGIEDSDCLIAIISPDYLVSPLCNADLTHARQVNKRIIPVLRQEFEAKELAGVWYERKMTEEAQLNLDFLTRLNWIYIRDGDDFNAAFNRLIQAISIDLDYVKLHTRLLQKAIEWERTNHDPSYLISGTELQQAETWLGASAINDPPPTELQVGFIAAAQKRQASLTRRRRQASIIVALLAIISAGATFVASMSNQAAANAEATLIAQQYTATAEEVIATTRAADQLMSTQMAIGEASRAALNRGDSQSELGNYDAAIMEYTEAIRLNSMLADAYAGRGIAYAHIGNLQSAAADLSQAIELAPDSAQAYYYRGNVSSQLAQYENALTDYSRAIELEPTFANAYIGRGLASFQVGDYDGAMENLNRAIQLAPDSGLAHYYLGNVYSELSRYEEAIADYRTAINLDSSLVVAYAAVGLASAQLGEYQQALEYLSRALELNPRSPDAYRLRGFVSAQLGDYQRAIADLDQAIQFDPRSAISYYYRGNAYSQLGEYEVALVDYTNALALDVSLADAYAGRGIAFATLDIPVQAIADLREYAQLAGERSDPTIVHRLSELESGQAAATDTP